MGTAWPLLLVSLLQANPFLEEGKQFYRDMLYPQAADRLRVSLRAPNLTREERREAFDLLARSLAAQGQLDEAEQLYKQLLEKDPSAPAPLHAAPKIRQAFQHAKENLYPRDFVQLTLVAVSSASLELAIVDPWQSVRDVNVFEAPPDQAFTQLETSIDGTGRVTGRLNTSRQPVRYYAVATNSEGRPVAQLGSANAPLSYGLAPKVRVDPGPDVPLTGVTERPPESHPTWVAWGLATTAVLAVAAAVTLAVSAYQDYTRPQPVALDRRAANLSAQNKADAAYVCGGVAIAAGTTALVLRWRWQ